MAVYDVPRSTNGPRLRWLGALAIVLLWAISLGARTDNIVHRPLMSHAEDATGHVWATLESMEHAPLGDHKLLPLITMPQAIGDKGVDSFLGASVTDGNGDYFYVSFPPAGFMAPYLVFEALHIEPTILALRLFSAALGLASALILYLLALELARGGPGDERRAVIGATAVAALSMLNSESLWIFGNVYWHHVLMEPFLLLTLLGLARHLREASAATAVWVAAALTTACLIEWAAFGLAGGIGLVGGWLLFRKRPGGAALVAVAAISAPLAAAAIVYHFSQVAGMGAYLSVLEARPGGHATGPRAAIQSIYALGGLYAPIAALLIFVAWGSVRVIRRGLDNSFAERCGLVLFAAAAGCAEAVLLLQHTTWYTYGSLPLTTFALLLLYVVFLASARSAESFSRAAVACCAAYAGLYFIQNPPGLANTSFGRQFDGLDQIAALAEPDETVFANLDWPLGVALGRARRNIVGSPLISAQPRPDQLIGYLKKVPAARGKLFLFSVDRSPRHQWVWWPYTKSRVIYRPADRLGPLAAVISFDETGVKAIRRIPGVPRPAILDAWTAAASGKLAGPSGYDVRAAVSGPPASPRSG